MAIYAGTGRTKAYINLVNMETEIKTLIKTLLPALVGVGVGLQLLFALGMIWYSQGALRPPSMRDEEPESLYVGLLNQSLPPRISTLGFVADLRVVENGLGPLYNVAGRGGQDDPLPNFRQRPRRRQ